MLLKFLEYIWDILQKAPGLRPVLARFRLLRIKIRSTIKKRPYTVIFVLGFVAAFIIFNPDYSPYTPPETCGVINLDKGQLYNGKGDELALNGKRPCEPQDVQAIEFFNLSNVDLESNSHFVRAVSGGLFVKQTAIGIKNKSQWHEYTLFTKSNDFVWNPANPDKDAPIEQFSFDKGECYNSKTFENQNVETETRQGIVIRSPDYRADPKLPYDKWRYCNYGAPGKKGFETCNYLVLEFFLPIGTQTQQCPTKTFLDTWLGIGTKRSVLIDPNSHRSLSKLAQDRWDKKRIQPVPEETYEQLTTGTPKVCMRWNSLDGKDTRPWQEFARISSVWCDL